ncbi:MAG: hypothetical protein QOK15_1356 [Nocardioidaceae bacterium]|nr:hypothetical protein [Nocardioidaceae bacterium]
MTRASWLGTPVSLVTAGLQVQLRNETGRDQADLLRSVGSWAGAATGPSTPAVSLVLDPPRRRAGEAAGTRTVTRGVRVDAQGVVSFRSTGGSGFDQSWTVDGDGLEVRSTWNPSYAELAASRMRSRFRALRSQVVVHYPVLWWAGTQGRAPLHVSVLEVAGTVVMLAGPGGVGKSTLVSRELGRGARATCDNLAVCDGTVAYGLSEPLRLDTEAPGAAGARTTHGRREHTWQPVPELTPDVVVVLRRGTEGEHRMRPTAPEVARRALVAGTMAAGELRRFWAVQAVVGLATGSGPVLPEVEAVADQLATRLPCYELELGTPPGASLSEVLGRELGTATDDLHEAQR